MQSETEDQQFEQVIQVTVDAMEDILAFMKGAGKKSRSLSTNDPKFAHLRNILPRWFFRVTLREFTGIHMLPHGDGHFWFIRPE